MRHLQQNIDMPEVHLVINPQIQAIVNKARSENRRSNANDIGDLSQDSNFLNSLQQGVNRWIGEIRKVTKLDRDPLSGTAIQETTFWANLERELSRINAIRESDEVTLTLDALKLGKRFHATTSFDADTGMLVRNSGSSSNHVFSGLKEMLQQASEYNQVMRDIPLNDLMSAADIDGIRQALVSIFSSIKKIRGTKYPAKRASNFFSTISTDTCTQLTKVRIEFVLGQFNHSVFR